jgi:hypothetical protein
VEDAAASEAEGGRLAARRYLEQVTARRYTCDDPRAVRDAYERLYGLAVSSGEAGWVDAVKAEMRALLPASADRGQDK